MQDMYILMLDGVLLGGMDAGGVKLVSLFEDALVFPSKEAAFSFSTLAAQMFDDFYSNASNVRCYRFQAL